MSEQFDHNDIKINRNNCLIIQYSHFFKSKRGWIKEKNKEAI